MGVGPSYGETPLDGEELDALEPRLLEEFAEPPGKADVFDLESTLLVGSRLILLEEVDAGELRVDDLLTVAFLKEWHRGLFAGIWTWAGKFRRTLLNIGSDPHLIETEVYVAMDNLRYQWRETNVHNARQLGIATHAELVRIHPFTDGNGRATRLMADLIFAAAQVEQSRRPHEWEYDWNLDKREYIRLLQKFDENRDP
ncbi:Fic family protein [Corynebacterium sp. TA-R-1]|uniref:Fic family protein n=1 Tax=Corynebacterium stercoris TaxID=2943490 RepID=A0ABT1G2R7_9CORY|nr:Fic family protein [Corynebacterium stercoris]MCP1387288.1 Fic family protein [Corynebacterium stercoris]